MNNPLLIPHNVVTNKAETYENNCTHAKQTLRLTLAFLFKATYLGERKERRTGQKEKFEYNVVSVKNSVGPIFWSWDDFSEVSRAGARGPGLYTKSSFSLWIQVFLEEGMTFGYMILFN